MATSNERKGEEKNEGAEEDSYPYQLVKFHTKNKRGEVEMDCVPLTWITFNGHTEKCECKFLPPTYNADDFDLLHGFVKQRAPPPEDWPSYPVTLCGHASKYFSSFIEALHGYPSLIYVLLL